MTTDRDPYILAFLVVLLSTLALGGYFVAAASEQRLLAMTHEAEWRQMRVRALDRVLRIVTDAEDDERRYLLSGDAAYLAAYQIRIDGLEPALAGARQRFPQPPAAGQEEWLATLTRLARAKVAEMDARIAASKAGTASVSVADMRTGPANLAMAALREHVRDYQREQGEEIQDLKAAAQTDITTGRAITGSSTLLNLILLVVGGRHIWDNLRRRALERELLALEKAELERQVRLNATELSNLSRELQQRAEHEKSTLARALHDELGGVLVAATMDIAALRRRLAPDNPEAAARLDRVSQALDAGVALKRRMVEQLYPTLLDNMGLFAALRWQLQQSCKDTGVRCVDSLPEQELELSRDAGIAIFRVAQEAITNVLRHARARRVDLEIVVEDDDLVMIVRDDGKGMSEATAQGPGQGLAGMRHRLHAFGGSWATRAGPDGIGTEIEVRLPLGRIRESVAATADAVSS